MSSAPEDDDMDVNVPVSSLFKYIQQNANALLHSSQNLFKKSKTLEERNATLEGELQEAKAQNERLGKQIDDCYNIQISRLACKFKGSDMYISKELDGIYQGLLNWVLELPDIPHFERAWLNFYQYLNGRGYTGSFVVALSPETTNHAQPELLAYGIFRILWNSIFEPILVGADPEMRKCLECVVENMAKLDPKIDPEILSFSRSNALRACAKSTLYQGQVEQQCDRLTENVKAVLAHILFKGYFDESHCFRRFKEQIAKPAAELSTTLKCSTETYRWAWYCDSKLLQKQSLSRHTVIDYRTHCQIMKEKFQAVDDDIVLGSVLLPIFPALLRETDGPEWVTVGNGYILMKIHEQDTTSRQTDLLQSTSRDGNQKSRIKMEPTMSPTPTMQTETVKKAEPPIKTEPVVKIEPDASQKGECIRDIPMTDCN
ncbi:uncharacterized protein N7459_009219 [Penicillium hispanicum]|uniref:uncharacterized protein n=1 Tax=Penicillium hispanicum TaxID=1080232 RepID=UPI00253FAC17|nr:uncharacterized protein N7459_009219 [Penicillium hispanicum]KAJ5569789.1 hypothetical protein N7459_009219 [Penicillium hispanicum]